MTENQNKSSQNLPPKKEDGNKKIEINPKRDFRCRHKGKLFDLKKGEKSKVPKSLEACLKTEKVI